MFDLSYLDPPIEVAATSPRLDMIMSRLRTSGMRPYAAEAPIDFNAVEPLLLDIRSLDAETLGRVARARSMGLPRPLVVLAPAAGAADLTDALVIRRDRDLVQLRARLASQTRRAAREAEFRIRRETADAFGLKRAPVDPDMVPEVLYLGDGGAGFLALQSALRAEGVSVTAALSVRTARDYLETGRFAAMLTDLTPRASGSAAFIDWTSPDAALAGAPLFALTDPESDLTEQQLSALAICSDLVEFGGEPEALAARIAGMIRRYVATAPDLPQMKMSSPVVDPLTGLYRRAFIESHLQQQMHLSDTSSQPLSILAVRIEAETPQPIGRFAKAVRKRLRDTDCPAMHSPGTLVISMPMTPYRGGVKLAERLVRGAAREAELDVSQISWRVVEKRAYHSVQTLLGASLAGPFTRAYAA